ncbi:uncharacterized protein LOC116137978 [Pistacia vera]|uniref:uncharacterized protein LOC116137978 n=1 Tax=Pistacia vera TaxID=55513 RepID=UPI00126375D4|nr:uncharacterized protein LOC116137978 [Pistacia vera]
MPRPGPRPYECVRRAWHSERHQPMRGSLIQEIFRVVSEIHSSATKKNKEWQEKLPVVVLKSEEIMYSKANSEAEYMDLKTLWDRTNDAINTIIRRDESSETGELLPPCIEAALNLGCMPRRTSRSQRNSHPRCYLNSGTQEQTSLENITQGNQTVNPHCMPHYSTLMKPTSTDVAQNPVVQSNIDSTKKLPFASENVPPSINKQFLRLENFPSLNWYAVYPLFNIEELPHGFQNFPNSTSNSVEPAKEICVQNSSVKIAQPYINIRDAPEIPHDIGCDLSLRLGPLSIPSPSVEKFQLQQVKNVGSSSLEGNEMSDLTPQLHKQLIFCSNNNVDGPLDMCSSQWSDEDNVDTRTRKRKAVSIHQLEDQHFWQSKLPYNQLTGGMKSAGS